MTDRVLDLAPPSDDRVSPRDLEAIQNGFNLGRLVDVEFLAAGLMNENWRVRADSGSYALKRISDVSVDLARRNLRVMAQLAERGYPVCQPVVTTSGDAVLEASGGAYCAVPWVSGVQLRGRELSMEQAGALGDGLARLHVGLNSLGDPDLPAAARRPNARVADPGQASGQAERFLSHISGVGLNSPFDRFAVEFLEQRKLLLSKYEHLRPSAEVSAGPFGWTHGDFQHLNVIWCDGDLAAVIDWDRIKVRVFGEEVARSATLLFSRDDGWLDLARVSAFVSGYRRSVDIADSDLVDAVDRLWWKRMCDYWHLEFHYDRDDQSCDHLFPSASRFLAWWTDRLDEVRGAITAAG